MCSWNSDQWYEHLVAEGECIHEYLLRAYFKATVDVLFSDEKEGLEKMKEEEHFMTTAEWTN